MYAALRHAAPLRRCAVSALAAAVLHQQQPAAAAAAAPRLPAQLPTAAAAAWFHLAPAWLGFRETGTAGASARAQFAEEGSFYEDEKRAGGGAGAGASAAAQEGLEIAKLGISSIELAWPLSSTQCCALGCCAHALNLFGEMPLKMKRLLAPASAYEMMYRGEEQVLGRGAHADCAQRLNHLSLKYMSFASLESHLLAQATMHERSSACFFCSSGL